MRNPAQSKFIGLMVDPTANLLVGMLGIVKSGHGFVPIDPDQPVARIQFILDECEIEILITENKYLDVAQKIVAGTSFVGHIICLDHASGKSNGNESPAVLDRADWDKKTKKQSRHLAGLDETVYAIYTSGSTGTPKCVPISHANLMPLLLWSKEYFGFGEHTRTLQTLSHWFDFGIFEILTTVIFGGTLYFFDKKSAGDLLHYINYANQHSINTIHSVPSFFKEIVAYREPLSSLEIMHLGGEQLAPQLADDIFALVGDGCVVYNGYGPTEASVNCSIFSLGTKATSCSYGADGIPIGKASAANSLYILDENYQPVPVGVAGELLVGGPGLSDGYLKRPELTAEKFVPHPFSREPGRRLYRTGDLTRYRSDGQIEYLGRLDHQVKIRGFRIELGEIETALRQMTVVKEALVMAREDHQGEKHLVAYLSIDPQQAAPTGVQLRAFLRPRLVEYMIPSAFVLLDEMPLTSNGKIDRRALPAPEQGFSEWQNDYVAPRTPVEEMIVMVCEEVLGLERLGVNDNLFDLGCHSLLAIKITARLRETLLADVSLLAFFEAPTVAGLAESVEAISQVAQPMSLPPIKPRKRESSYPLSFAQESIWFLDQVLVGNTSYFVPRAVRFKGHLSVKTVERTFTELVRRHEILRTVFPAVDGQPVQIIQPPQPFHVPLIDLQHLPEGESESFVEQFILEEGQRPFDLARGLMLRVTVLQLSAEDYVLVLVEHHLVHDGWTQGVLLSEFLAIYSAFVRDEPSPLPELPVQFVDFAFWQREWLQGEVLEKLLAYWKNQLAGAPPVLHLPTDHPRPSVLSFEGAELTLHIPEKLADALRVLSRSEGVTMFMTMMAVFQTMFHRYTGQDDFCVGTAVANRRCREIEGLLGMIVNTLVLRADLSGNPSFREVLTRVRKVCLEAYAHQDMPFEKLVEELQPERDLRYLPLIQVMVAFLDTPMEEMELPGLSMSLMDVHNHSSKFDLNVVFILPAEQGLGMAHRSNRRDITVLFEYNTSLFEAATIERMMRHFRQLLEAVVSQVDQRIGELPMLTATEERQLLVDWNATRREYPTGYLHQLIEAQAHRNPDAVALVFENQQLTYGQLNARANQVANQLQALGVGPESRVGILMDSSLEMVVGLLGILKAGGAYVPLDPQYPTERLAYMLADSQATVLLTQSLLVERVGPVSGQIIALDRDWEFIGKQGCENPQSGAVAENLAYVIYTSGSTGQPRAVEITHHSLLNLVNWHQQAFQTGVNDRTTQVASPAFDAAVWELWPSLAAGATVYLAGEEVRYSAEQMQQWLVANGITQSFQPTPIAERLLSLEWPGKTTLRLMLTGGDKLHHAGRGPRPFLLCNNYGPTECTVVATSGLVEQGGSDQRTPGIGRPIANTELFIVDASMQPVAIGVAGELYLGGDGLARAYLNQPGLTAEHFLPHPFNGKSGARLYRTGDMARYRPDGTVEFLGRRDQQVKVRGFRIELGEIEAVLLRHPQIDDAVVVALEETPKPRRLVAYLIFKGKAEPTDAELRRFLKERLPEHMIPATFVTISSLPLLPSGKVDRRKLPAPHLAAPDAKPFIGAGTPVEEILSAIWTEVLEIDEVSINDDFFECGGHSLIATQVVSRVRETFRIELPLRTLFENPTIAQWAGSIEERLTDETKYLLARDFAQVQQLSGEEVLARLDSIDSK